MVDVLVAVGFVITIEVAKANEIATHTDAGMTIYDDDAQRQVEPCRVAFPSDRFHVALQSGDFPHIADESADKSSAIFRESNAAEGHRTFIRVVVGNGDVIDLVGAFRGFGIGIQSGRGGTYFGVLRRVLLMNCCDLGTIKLLLSFAQPGGGEVWIFGKFLRAEMADARGNRRIC